MFVNLQDFELDFIECLYNPIALAEILFSDFDSLTMMKDLECGEIRLYQVPMLSFEYIVDYNSNLNDDPILNEKENFKLLEGAGTVYNYGARKYGKSLITLILDILESCILLGGWETVFTSYDAVHIRNVLEKIIPVLENHKFLRLFDAEIKRSPSYSIRIKKNGFLLQGVNMNILSKDSGSQFFGLHVKKIWVEEASRETKAVKEKRIDAISELGCIERVSGMTDFIKYSPSGEVFYDISNKSKIINLPQFCNPTWGEREKSLAIKKYSGETSIGYRVFVLGEVVEDGVSVFDMDRIRPYNEDRKLKNFEIIKRNYFRFKEIIIVVPLKNAKRTFMFADIGESAPTEIGIIFEINELYRYEYNITLQGLTDKEQSTIFLWLINQLNINFFGIDCSDGTGRAIYRSLEESIGKDRLVWVSFQEKIKVGYERTDDNNIVMKEGIPVFKEEFVSEWSIKHLKDLLYERKVDIPLDYKLDLQLNSVISSRSINRTTYDCLVDNHLLQAFQVFSIMEWRINEFGSNLNLAKRFAKSGC